MTVWVNRINQGAALWLIENDEATIICMYFRNMDLYKARTLYTRKPLFDFTRERYVLTGTRFNKIEHITK